MLFVFPRVYHSLAFVSIRPKVWTGKYHDHDHLALDGVSSRMLDRKKNSTTWKRFNSFFLLVRDRNSEKPLPSIAGLRSRETVLRSKNIKLTGGLVLLSFISVTTIEADTA